jgi:hypothetical protein
MFTLGVKKNKLILGSLTGTGSGAKSEVILAESDGVIANEWHRIRVECYDLEDGTGAIKFFLDEELLICSDLYYGSHSSSAHYNSTFRTFQIYSRLHFLTECYLDNVYLNSENKMFDADSDDISDLRDL